MSRIVFFHGYASSGAVGTVDALRRMLPECEILAPDIPVDPEEALPYLRQYCAEKRPDLIIGTSMGGMYAQQMFGFRKICVNPAFNMSQSSKMLKTGTHKFLNGRKDSAKEFTITRETIRHFNMMERAQFKGITEFDVENTYGLFGIGDPLVNTYDLFRKHYPNARRFEGEHNLNETVLRKEVLPLVRQILGPEARECRTGAYGRVPVSSAGNCSGYAAPETTAVEMDSHEIICTSPQGGENEDVGYEDLIL